MQTPTQTTTTTGSGLIQNETPTMRRCSRFTRALVLPLVLVGVLANAPLATAGVITNHSGAICKNLNAADVTFIDYDAFGTRSLKLGPTDLICPLTRNTSNGNGALVYIDVTVPPVNGPQLVECSVLSLDYTGKILGSTSANWSGSGFHEFALNLAYTGMSTQWSDYSAGCTVTYGTYIHGVDLVEN